MSFAHFVRALTSAGNADATPEADSASPLQTLAHDVLGRPLIGNGTTGSPGSGQPGEPGGLVIGNCGRGGLPGFFGTHGANGSP